MKKLQQFKGVKAGTIQRKLRKTPGKEVSYQNENKNVKDGEFAITKEELVFQNEEKEKLAAELIIVNKEFVFQNEEKERRAAELIVANGELVFQNEEKEKRAAELIIANKELVFQNEEKEKRAAELIIANKELVFQNEEKEKRAAELIVANKELAFQNEEKEKRAAELIVANSELVFQNEEKEKRAAELIVANGELVFQNEEKEKRAAELIIANKELAFQNEEKEKRAAELIIANKELAFQNEEKEKRAAELVIANKELVFQNEEKEKRAAELIMANKELTLINGTDDLIWSVSQDFKLIAANKAFIERVEITAGISLKAGDDLLIREIVSDDYLIFWQGCYEKVLSGQSLKEEVYTPALNDWKESWADIRFNPVYKNETVVAVACYSRNITEKKIADKRLMQSETRLAQAQAISHIGNWEINLTGNFHYWSDEIYQIFGITKGDVIPSQETFMSFCHPEDLNYIYEVINEGFKTLQNISFYFRFIRRDGDVRHSYNEWRYKFDKNGNPEFLSGIFQDVTERKRAEERNKFKAELLNTIGQAVIATDVAGIINFWNKAAGEIYGWTADEALGKNVSDIITAQKTKEQSLEIMSQLAQGNSHSGEFLVQHKNGKTFPVFVTEAPTYDQNHKLSGIIGISVDVSERKKIEAALEKTNERLLIAQEITQRALDEKDTILESIGDGFFAVDKNWKVTYWNSQAEKLLNTSREAILGRNLWDIFSNSIDSVSYKNYHLSIKTGRVINFEDYYPTLMKWYEIATYPSDNGLAVYFKNITDRKLSEINLNELNANLSIKAHELAQSNAELEQFAYVASHDLQEPLRTITSFLTLLKKKYENIIDDKGKKYIDFAVDGSKRMQQIIQDLLDFSKVGRVDDQQEDISLNDIIQEIKILFQKQIDEKNAIINVGELPVIKCYKTPIRQAFQNLISNALKYSTKEIPVRIHVSATPMKDHWQFCVADNGIGIDNEYFEKIFVLFQRLHNKDEFSGTGIGLPVTKKIIENLGGKIWVESEEGKGSSFYFTLPGCM